MINHKKYNLNDYTITNLKALAFHASVRVRLKSLGTIKVKVNGKDRIIGIKVRAQIIKNRLGPPLRAADFDIYFDSGIDDYGSWLEVAKDNKIVSQGGAWYSYVDTETGEEFKFQSKDWHDILDKNEGVRSQIYNKICEATIIQYKTNPRELEDIKVDTAVPGDE